MKKIISILFLIIFLIFQSSCGGFDNNPFNIKYYNDFYLAANINDTTFSLFVKPNSFDVSAFTTEPYYEKLGSIGEIKNGQYYLKKNIDGQELINGEVEEQDYFNTLDDLYNQIGLDVFFSKTSLNDFVKIQKGSTRYKLKDEKLKYYEDIFSVTNLESIYIDIVTVENSEDGLNKIVNFMLNTSNQNPFHYRFLIYN